MKASVSTDREPLGVLDAWMWARDEPRGADGQRGGLSESTRWLESYQRLAERAGELPTTRLVQVGDRESDIPALMQGAQAVGWPVDILVRSKHNRRLPDGERLWDEHHSKKCAVPRGFVPRLLQRMRARHAIKPQKSAMQNLSKSA